MTKLQVPGGLGLGGTSLWKAVTADHELDALQQVQLTEACRAKDRLDRLDLVLRGDIDTWARLMHRTRTQDYELKIDDSLRLANATADELKKLLAALRLPDAVTGRRPPRRPPRGVHAPPGVSSLDRARQRAAGRAGG